MWCSDTKHKRLLITIISLISMAIAHDSAIALDAGLVGPTYGIREPDFLEDIKRTVQAKVNSGEWKKLQDGLQKRAKAHLFDPPSVQGLSVATHERHWLFDPSIVLSRNVLDTAGRIVFPAGTRVNPLDVVSLPQPLLFFDGRDARQIAAAQKIIKKYGGSVTPILVGGSWQTLGKEWKRQVFFDQDGRLVNQLGIHAVPAVVTQEARALRVEEFAP